MAIQYTVVSIGALSRNPFWGETTAVRTAHATTTLIRTGDRKILVDPALPATVLDARLFERTGLHLADIDTVFLTTFRTAHRMGLPALEGARWYIHPAEKDWAKAYLEEMRGRLKKEAPVVDDELALLERCKAPEDKLAEGVELFPSPGASPGGCGLLLTPVTGSVVIAGDAVIGDFSQIGMNATVNIGVRIGRECLIGNGATVKKDVPDGTRVFAGQILPPFQPNKQRTI